MGKTSVDQSAGLIRIGSGRQRNLWKTNMILMILLVLMIFFLPVVLSKDGDVSRILLILIVVSGLYAADFSRSVFRILFTLGSIVVFLTLFILFFLDSKTFTILTFFLNTLFFVLVTIALVAHVANAKQVVPSTILCAINSYLMLGLTMSILMIILDLFIPQSFGQLESGSDSYSAFIYFGFVTLTTLGYGDILPVTPAARSLSIFTALFGQLYLVIIMALIIGKYLNTKERNKN